MADGLSPSEMYESCCKRSLGESLICAKMLSSDYGYDGTLSCVKTIIKEYNGSGKLPGDTGERILGALENDLDNDTILNGMARYDDGFAKLGKYSVIKSLETFKKTLSLYNGEYDKVLGFILYNYTLEKKEKHLDQNKNAMNAERMMRIYNDYPDAAFAFIKDQYTFIFEKLWKPCLYEYVNIIGRYPGIGKEAAGILIEDIMCASRCYDGEDGYKCDLREIRNAFAHENYAYDEQMRVRFRDKSVLKLEFKQMMSLIHLMEYKCMYVNLVLPLITLSVFAKMNDSF